MAILNLMTFFPRASTAVSSSRIPFSASPKGELAIRRDRKKQANINAKERSEKNPVYYVQYAHARISSILRKASSLKLSFRNFLKLSFRLEPKERALIFELLKFPDLVSEISQNYAVHHLPQYAMGLADRFHSFYDECRVIDESNLELTAARLELVKAVKIVLAEVLRLMGISAPDKM